MRQIPAKIWVPVMAVILAAVSLAVILNLPKEEKAPEVGVPKETPEEEITQPERIVWNVQEKIEQKQMKEIQKVVNEYLFPESRELLKEGQVISINHLNLEEEWAIISYGSIDKESGKPISTGGAMLLLRKINDSWQVTAPREAQFCQWLPLVPESLMSSENKEFYQMICF